MRGKKKQQDNHFAFEEDPSLNISLVSRLNN